MFVEPSEIRTQAEQISWFHTLDLGHGIVTPGATDPGRNLLPSLHLPSSLAGLDVLDVGAWDGFYSFECERRGAARVLATDSYAWSGEGWGTRDGFDFAHKVLGSRVDSMVVDVMDLSPERVGGQFDLVLLLGVVYHLRDPITAIERVASVTRSHLILETELRFDWLPWAAGRLYPGTELNGDGTNWWALNTRALRGLLREFGFRRIDVVWRSPALRRTGRVLRAGLRERASLSLHSSRRIVVHAWK
jgi:tRNA (mo5U34)-methyltransferase